MSWNGFTVEKGYRNGDAQDALQPVVVLVFRRESHRILCDPILATK